MAPKGLRCLLGSTGSPGAHSYSSHSLSPCPACGGAQPQWPRGPSCPAGRAHGSPVWGCARHWGPRPSVQAPSRGRFPRQRLFVSWSVTDGANPPQEASGEEQTVQRSKGCLLILQQCPGSAGTVSTVPPCSHGPRDRHMPRKSWHFVVAATSLGSRPCGTPGDTGSEVPSPAAARLWRIPEENVRLFLRAPPPCVCPSCAVAPALPGGHGTGTAWEKSRDHGLRAVGHCCLCPPRHLSRDSRLPVQVHSTPSHGTR